MTLDNWQTIAVQSVIVATAALGMTMIMIAGGIDLSVGSTVALVTVCVSRSWSRRSIPACPDHCENGRSSLPVALAHGVVVGGSAACSTGR